MASSGSSPYIPEPVKIAFRCFSDNMDPRMYAAPSAHDEIVLLHDWCDAGLEPTFNFTEWWTIAEGEKLSRPFNVGDELVGELLRVLEKVNCFTFIYAPYSTRYRGWRAQSFVLGQ
jgi:hypothetical protein